jgi:MoaA/NifB/PqqE/SkfB family radical SAM enzyme
VKIKENLSAARKLGAKFVDFTGGEPLLFHDLPDALREAKKLGFITSVTTNGLLLKKRAEELKGLIDLPRLSIDGSETVHNSIRGVDCYKAAVEGLAEAVKVGLRYDIIFTLTKENGSEIEHVYSLARQNKAILILDPSFKYFGNDDAREQDELLRKWSWRRGVYVNTAFLSLREAGGNSTEKPVCKAGDAVIVISPDNKLLLPCFHASQEEIEISGRLEKVWKDIGVMKSRKMAGRYGACEGCSINCYMDPSFCYQVNGYFFRSMIAKAKYSFEKYL